MITCFIVDDEPIARRGLREYITREGDIKILAECENIIELRMRLQEMSPDIIFLDIEMPYASGMDWLSTANTSSLVILTTAYEQYALRSYDFNVVDIFSSRFLTHVSQRPLSRQGNCSRKI